MTTTVRVEAHCNFETTIVSVKKTGVGTQNKVIYLSDSESYSDYIYGDQQIIVQEISKDDSI